MDAYDIAITEGMTALYRRNGQHWHWRIQGGPGGAMAPLAAWASTQNALKVAIFRLKIEKIFCGGGNAPSPDPS